MTACLTRGKSVLALVMATIMMLSISLFTIQPSQASAAEQDLGLEVESAVLIEAQTGQILYDFNKDQARPPASMAKMMSEYIVLEQISSGKLSWEDKVTISSNAAGIGGSGGLLAAGEIYTVEELFKNMSIFSGNDATIALAERIAGTEEKFSQMMNDTARALGLSDTAYFINATGLPRDDMKGMQPESLPGETSLTALDAALIARQIILKHPEALEHTSTTEAYLKPNDERYLMKNWNWMLEGWIPYNNNFSKLAYEGLDGLKTGHTRAAGYCFTGTAERDGLRLISVVMGTSSEQKRFLETRKLLDFGFDNFEFTTVLHPKAQLPEMPSVGIAKGKVKQVSVVTEAGMSFLVSKGSTPDNFVMEVTESPPEERVAPIAKGDVMGKVTVTYTGEDGAAQQQEVNLISTDDAEKANWFVLLLRSIGGFFKDLFNGIKNLF